MYSILDEVDKYIKEHGISFKSFTINNSYLPSYVNQAILERIRNIRDSEYDFGCEEYTISYDDNGVLYLMAHDFYNHVNLCIINGKLAKEFDFSVTLVKESTIIKEACILKYLQKERLNIRRMICDNYSELSNIDRIKLENRIIDNLMLTMNQRLKENGENISNIVNFDSDIANSVRLITKYVSHLNDCYFDSINENNDDVIMNGIRYTEPDADNIPRNNKGIYNGGNNERHNSIIPASERISILESYPFIYREYAYSKSSNEIDYFCYMYQISNNGYVIIMEPYSGTKYTKIAIVRNDEELSKDDFIKYIRYYLELSYLEIGNTKNVIRSNHTSLDVYKNTTNYIINGNNNIKNDTLKKRIKIIKEQ